MTIREQIINSGVRNLKEYGYEDCNAENILTDKIYAAFFLEMVKDAIDETSDQQVDALKELKEELEKV